MRRVAFDEKTDDVGLCPELHAVLTSNDPSIATPVASHLRFSIRLSIATPLCRFIASCLARVSRHPGRMSRPPGKLSVLRDERHCARPGTPRPGKGQRPDGGFGDKDDVHVAAAPQIGRRRHDPLKPFRMVERLVSSPKRVEVFGEAAKDIRTLVDRPRSARSRCTTRNMRCSRNGSRHRCDRGSTRQRLAHIRKWR